MSSLFYSRRHRMDQEFLPAALSILETPPSPVKIWLIWSICLLFTLLIGWSYFGQIDIIAVAQGKIQPTGRVKTIQPVKSGKIIAIHVKNGEHVTKGDLLVRLDQEEAQADEASVLASLLSAQAEQQRHIAAFQAIDGAAINKDIPIDWPETLPQEIRLREMRILKGELSQLDASIQSLEAQLTQKQAEVLKLTQTINIQQTLIETLQERVNMRTTLFKEGSGSKANLIDATEVLQTQQALFMSQKGQLKEAQAAMDVLRKEQLKTIETFRADQSQKLAQAEREIEEEMQKLTKARTNLKDLTIISPIDGVVIGSSVTTMGQVVTASEELMRIVPDDSTLEIEAYLENKDIGFVTPSQEAIVKIDSFPFTQYGVLNAKVIRVAHDAIPEPDAQTIEGNPAKTTRANFFGGAERTQNLVFPVTLTFTQKTMEVEGTSTPLTPGMTVLVEIKTGKRRILDYIFSPLFKTASSALRER